MRQVIEGVGGPRRARNDDLDGLEVRVAVESMRPYWDDVMRWAKTRFRSAEDMDGWSGGTTGGSLEGHFDVEGFLIWSGLERLEYESLQHGMARAQTVPFDLCDKLMTAAGMQYLVTSLYIVHQTRVAPPGTIKAPPPEPMTGEESWHGTAGGYNNNRCRCERCKEAKRVYMRAYSRRRRALVKAP